MIIQSYMAFLMGEDLCALLIRAGTLLVAVGRKWVPFCRGDGLIMSLCSKGVMCMALYFKCTRGTGWNPTWVTLIVHYVSLKPLVFEARPQYRP